MGLVAHGAPLGSGDEVGVKDHSSNRRLGARIDVHAVDATLVVYLRPARGVFRAARTRVAEIMVRVVDLSLSGARIEGPGRPIIAPGSIVLLRVNGTESQVRVARVEPHRDGRACSYGLEFGHLDEEFERQVHATFDDQFDPELWFTPRPADPEDAWGRWLS